MEDNLVQTTAAPATDPCGHQNTGTYIGIEGITHQLDGDRSVFVGQVPGESGVYLKFFNGELDTKVRLSFEAAKALRHLLGSISSRGLMSTCTWVLVAEEKPVTPSSEERSDTVDPLANTVA